MASLPRQSPGGMPPGPDREPRLLFLDDDPSRAEVFLAHFPNAVWVQTVEDCLARLEEPWDEVHLDHDLGGEHYVDVAREDCGMEIIRWLCLVPRPHLMPTRFYIHSHNESAASIMVWQMEAAGYRVKVRPFGAPTGPRGLDEPFGDRTPALVNWLARLLALFRGGGGSGYGAR